VTEDLTRKAEQTSAASPSCIHSLSCDYNCNSISAPVICIKLMPALDSGRDLVVEFKHQAHQSVQLPGHSQRIRAGIWPTGQFSQDQRVSSLGIFLAFSTRIFLKEHKWENKRILRWSNIHFVPL
jgi:hypothetical protein